MECGFYVNELQTGRAIFADKITKQAGLRRLYGCDKMRHRFALIV